MLLEYELAVDGEMPERDFDRVVGAIRREVGGGGMVTAVGRSLTWSSDDPNHAASVSVTVRDGRTMLVVTQRLKAIAKPVFGGLMGSIGGGVGGVVFGGVMNATNGDPTFGLPAWLAVVATAYGVARFTFGRMVRKRRTWLRGFAEQLAEEIRSTIAERDRSRQLQQPSNSDERKRVR